MDDLQPRDRKRLVFALVRARRRGISMRVCGLGMILYGGMELTIRGIGAGWSSAAIWIVLGISMFQSIHDDALLLRLAKMAGIDVEALPRDKHTAIQVAILVCISIAIVLTIYFHHAG